MTNLQTSSTSTPALPESWIEKLFHRMLLTYGKKFSDQWGGADTDELIGYWAQELGSYTGQEIKRGIAAMESREWPPTLPEFKKLCRPPINPTVAYYEALAGVQARAAGEMGVWSHPATFWAAMPLSFDLSNQSYSQIRARWEAALDAQMELGVWEPIPQPALALPAPGKAELSKEAAANMLRELDARGVAKKASDRIDHKRWAKQIMQRIANGDKSVSLIQGQFARTALELVEEAA
jgi:hypothetical protein